MLDARLRPAKQLVLAPISTHLGPISPHTLTASGMVLGLAAAGAAALAVWWLGIVLLLVSRLLDGLDGELARSRGTSSDAGGYADIVADTVVYAAVPIGAAIGSSIDHIWIVTALLLASFYLNTITWTYLSAVIEKRRAGAVLAARSRRSEATSVVMPTGLVEGFETMVFFVVMLSLPRWLDWTMGAMAAAVTVGAVARFVGGQRRLDLSRTTDRGPNRELSERAA